MLLRQLFCGRHDTQHNGLEKALSINEIQHNAFSVIMLSVIVLSVIMQSVVMLNAVAPFFAHMLSVVRLRVVVGHSLS